MTDEALATTVMERISDAVIVVDRAGVVRFANPAASELFAVPHDELVGTDYRRFVPPELRDDHERRHADFLAGTLSRPMGPGPCVRARRADGRTVDIDVVLTLIGDGSVAVVARRASATRRMIDRLVATNHLLTTALSGAADDELGRQALDLVVEAMQAERGGIVRADGDERRHAMVHPDDDGAAALAERLTRQTDPAPPTDGDDAGARPPDGFHELIVPIPARGAVRAIGVWRADDDVAFDPIDAELLHTLGFAVATAFELVDQRLAGERQRTIVDHDRIARELHDRAIQHLFAVAMRLEAAVPEASGHAAERMSEAVAELDEVIHEIRTAIFDLRRPTIATTGLRSAISNEIDRVTSALGFSPRVHFSGVLDAAVSPVLTETTSAVVRELLANCARHAEASAITVDVANVDGRLDVVVRDDGRGFDPEATVDGDGLANIAARAHELGGRLDVTRTPGGGTEVRWSVPVTAGRQ